MERILLGVIVVSGTVPLTAAECHCNTTSACTVFPSAPCTKVGSPDRCQKGWFGAYCQKQNIALGMPAVQSSTYTESLEKNNMTSYYFPARLGVDGRTTTEFYEEPFTCTHTGQGSDQHYWRLSLKTTDKIEHLKLYLRNHTPIQHRDNGMEILVGSQMCYNWSSTERPPPIANVTCRQPLTGNTVTIRVPGGFDKHLTLCEVQIFVCSDGWFGTDCDKQCRCLNNTEVCDKNTGQCLGGCASGYTGIGCQTICSDGWFGTDCDKQCRCLNNTEVCDKNTGQCLGGCAPGYTGIGCQTICSDGWFGTDCDKQCRCLNNTEVCDKNTGQCLGGCASGYTGIGCQTSENLSMFL
ncbi:uncharacterized protein [Haliotis cracherodii]|uniref:uncharacterized protein n=1 Tax=Haliotis cracherodii TaxID=6455 RepID=UPI0039EB3D80